MLRILCLILCAAFSQLCGQCRPDAPTAEPFVVWTDDPCHTALIEWFADPTCGSPVVSIQQEGTTQETSLEGEKIALGESGEFLCRVELKGLNPGTTYNVKVAGEQKVFSFSTLPMDLQQPLRFVVGGDAFLWTNLFLETNEHVAKLKPEFIVIGGDIAYTTGIRSWFHKPSGEVARWKKFFHYYAQDFTNKEGKMIPLMVVVGNHDIPTMSTPGHDAFDYFFPHLSVQSYQLVKAGDYLRLFMLDTGHRTPIAGGQTDWLKNALNREKSVPYKISVYHVAAYPSVYSYDGKTPRRIRENWVPLFEEYGIQCAFEHHNHAYKASHPIKDGKIDPNGVLYFGDGSWGTPPRRPKHLSERWYLLEAKKANCFWHVELQPHICTFTAYEGDGKVLNRFQTLPNPQ